MERGRERKRLRHDLVIPRDLHRHHIRNEREIREREGGRGSDITGVSVPRTSPRAGNPSQKRTRKRFKADLRREKYGFTSQLNPR